MMICDFVWNMCGKLFKSQKTPTQHNRDVHIEEDIPCSLCDKTFKNKKHLAYHKFIKHTEKECLYCDIKSDDTECSYHTTSVSNLNAHKKRVHENCECHSTFAIQVCLFFVWFQLEKKYQIMMEHLNSHNMRSSFVHCFYLLCFHVPLKTITNKRTK